MRKRLRKKKWQMEFKIVDVNLPPKELKEFCENNDYFIIELNDKMEEAKIIELYNIHINSPYCSESILSEIAEHNNTPIDILTAIAYNAEPSTLLSLALNPNINKEIIEKLSKVKDYATLEHLVCNPAMTIDQLEKFKNSTEDEDLIEVIQWVFFQETKWSKYSRKTCAQC